MMKHYETKDGYVFANNDQTVAIGAYENGEFCLFYKDEFLPFNNAMQAFVHLRSIYEPGEASPQTMKLFTTPSRPIDNMSKWLNHSSLVDMPKEVFHANLPR